MSKEIENKICYFCESEYKLSYSADHASGNPKFCPFCGEENYDQDLESQEEDEE